MARGIEMRIVKTSCNIEEGYMIPGYGTSKCWSCQNTNGNLCGWFSADAVMPKGCKYRVHYGVADSVYRYVISSCPNYDRELEDEPVRIYRPRKYKPRKAPKQRELRYPDTKKPQNKIKLIKDKPDRLTKSYPLIEPIRWLANMRIYNEEISRQADIDSKIPTYIIQKKRKVIKVKTYNKLAEFINKVLEEHDDNQERTV